MPCTYIAEVCMPSVRNSRFWSRSAVRCVPPLAAATQAALNDSCRVVRSTGRDGSGGTGGTSGIGGSGYAGLFFIPSMTPNAYSFTSGFGDPNVPIEDVDEKQSGVS